MGRSEYQEILEEAEVLERTKGGAVWDLEAESTRLHELKLDEIPMDQKGWDRAVNVAYRKAALRAHPDKHPPDTRDAAEANFKRLNEANKIMLRVGKAIREEAESGNAEGAIAEQKKLVAEAEALEEARLASQLGQIMSMNGLSAGFGNTNGDGRLPRMEMQVRTRRDLEKQLIGLLARCGEEFKARARRRRRWRIIRRVLAGVAVGAFLWFVRRTAPEESGASRGEMREIAVAVRDAIRLMGRELAAAIGKPEAGEEMADDLEIAFLEGRMSVSEGGGLEVLIEDDEEAGMFYKLNMSSGGDGSMRVWTEGADGEQVDMKLDDVEDHEPTVGLFGLTNEGTSYLINFDEDKVKENEAKKKGKATENSKKSGGLFGGKR
mmetsp:Transcript_16953/g.27193  ORF Transcript_16953/g.27193 Transcript_16953/m.27193 type:complete len:379 (+) Transcript_16953:188-1324(+)